MEQLNSNIKIVEKERKKHSKASEEYIHVKFSYPGSEWDGWVPVEYRRTGISIKPDETEKLIKHLNSVYEQMNPKNFDSWLEKQEKFWQEEKAGAGTTKGFFDSLVKGGWQCVNCTLPSNPNWARRIQDLKEFGYTLATDTKRFCPHCRENKTHLILLPIERGGVEGNGYLGRLQKIFMGSAGSTTWVSAEPCHLRMVDLSALSSFPICSQVRLWM